MSNQSQFQNIYFRIPNDLISEKKIVRSSVKRLHIILFSLILFSFIPYAGLTVWTEAVILIIIFCLAIAVLFEQSLVWNTADKYLLAPIFILAVYSFIQGVTTLLIQNQVLVYSGILPKSADAIASFWCGIKFFAFAVFIKVLTENFRRNVGLLIWSLVGIGNFYAVLGVFRFLLQSAFPETFNQFLLPELNPHIGFGTFINQNHFAFLMLMTLGLNLGLLAYGKLAKDQKLFVLFLCLVTWSAIVLTGSRGGIVSSFVEIIVLLLLSFVSRFEKKPRTSTEFLNSKISLLVKRLLVFALIISSLIIGIILIGQERVIERFERIPLQFEGTTEIGTFRRIDIWRTAEPLITNNLPYGIGFGSFRFAVSRYIEISGEIVPESAHNDYLEFVACGGVIAVGCGIWFLLGIFLTLKKRFETSSSASLEKAGRIGAVCALAGIAVHSFFDFGLQLMANQLFLAGIISIGICSQGDLFKSEIGSEDKIPDSVFIKLCGSIFLLFLIIFAAIFGFSRLQLQFAATQLNQNSLPDSILPIPFDAEFYTAKALINVKSGNSDSAEKNLKEAINYHQQDYLLWLDLAKVQQLQSQLEDAENSFRQSIKLAPFYGEPHFYFGNFLILTKRNTEGFIELNKAFQRNPKYFEKVLNMVLENTGGDIEKTIKILSPFGLAEKEKLAAFLSEKKAFAEIVALTCRDEDIPPANRENLVMKLFEKRQFSYAQQIYKRDCNELKEGENNFDDGDFELDGIRSGTGFGWRINNLPDEVTVNLDKENYSSGSQSLKYIFDGSFEPSLPLLSQIVTVQKNRQYHLSFAFKAKEIISGGKPVLQIIFKQSDEDIQFKEILLKPNGSEWTKTSLTFQTNNQTEAVEIRLTRQSCGERLCPIFGQLWLDNFTLK